MAPNSASAREVKLAAAADGFVLAPAASSAGAHIYSPEKGSLRNGMGVLAMAHRGTSLCAASNVCA